MPGGFPDPIYAETVLAPAFDAARRHFLDFLLRIHDAHTRMLAKQGILTGEEERTLLAALTSLDRSRIAAARYDGAYEDLFFFVESLLEESCGRTLAGKMHTARSRNDIAITLYRMLARSELLNFAGGLGEARSTLIGIAAEHLDSIMPAHTHTQPAQPTTLAHYLLAACEFLGRDSERAQAAFARVNLCPLGAAAITTSGFPIDRHETARLLGFEALAENSYGAIASIDYITESAAVIAVAMVNLGKLVQDLLLWSTVEFGFLRLSDGFVQSSSIMPQKRNPVALEHARILASRALGDAQSVLTCAHNTPFGDINDSEDALQPLVLSMFDAARRALRLLAALLGTAEFNRERMARRAGRDFLTVTELADTLVREEGLSFREAHAAVSEAVKSSGSDQAGDIAAAIRRIRPGLRLTDEDICRALDPVNFVRIRDLPGGPAPERTGAALADARESQVQFESWLAAKRTLIEPRRA
jgi:argininosuccinate lyase